MQSDQRFSVSFSFLLYKTKNPEIAENSPKGKEKMLSLVNNDPKNVVIVTNLLRTVRCVLL